MTQPALKSKKVAASITKLLSQLDKAIRQNHLFQPDDTLIVAISAGADSTALLDLLTRLPGYKLHLIAAHINHSLRAASSDTDEEFCRALAQKYGVPFETRRVDVKAVATSHGLNLEDAARRVRIEFLDEIRMKYAARAVALAHHADDQAETVLMRLFRGSGMTGLSGMAYKNDRGYVRPLLNIARTDILAYLRGLGLNWREDASNSDTTYLRNRIRHQLLPLLETYNPAIRSSLGVTASIMRDEGTLLDEIAEQAFALSCRVEEARIVCNIRQLCTLNLAMRRRVLRRAFKQLVGGLDRLSFIHIDELCSMIDSRSPNGRLNLPQKVTAIREYNTLLLTGLGNSVSTEDLELLIAGGGSYKLYDNASLLVELGVSATKTINPNIIYFDLAKTPFPWLIRTFRPGDRIQPFGMSGRKKVKDVFIDKKIPLSERRQIPLLFCGEQLLWIPGVCASELSRVDPLSTAMIRVNWLRKPDRRIL